MALSRGYKKVYNIEVKSKNISEVDVSQRPLLGKLTELQVRVTHTSYKLQLKFAGLLPITQKNKHSIENKI